MVVGNVAVRLIRPIQKHKLSGSRSRKLSTQMHYLEVECIYLLFGEEQHSLGNVEYLISGEGALQPQVLHHALASLQHSHVRTKDRENY